MPPRIRRRINRGIGPQATIRRLLLTIGDLVIAHRQIGPFRVSEFSGEASPLAFEKLAAGIALVKTIDPRRYARLENDVARFVLVAAGGEFYDLDIHAQFFDLGGLGRRSIEDIALTIVHEATHARLQGIGIHYTPASAPRIEACCVAQEIAFAQRLPDGAQLASEAARKLDTPWWDQEAMAKRHIALVESIGSTFFSRLVQRRYRK